MLGGAVRIVNAEEHVVEVAACERRGQGTPHAVA